MSIIQSSHFQLDGLFNADVHILITQYFIFSIESHKKKELVQSKREKIQEEASLLLNNEA